MDLFKGLITALRTLSILPVPGKDAHDFSKSLYWFVLVGLLLGALLYAVTIGIYQGIGNQWPEASALLIVVLGIFLTRGMHLDGLADFADGFGGGFDRERTLAIMKDSSLGAFGVIALIIVLLAKWVVLARLFELSGAIWIISAYVISRTMHVDLMTTLPYARQEGTAGPFTKNAGRRHRFFGLLQAVVIVYLLNGLAGVGALIIIWSFTQFFGLWCLKRVGGITGDLVGACSEMTETLVLFLAVVDILVESIYF